MNNKGFTLVEVIVTIAIIGIISGIAFPSITKLQSKNEVKKYETYENVMKTAAKLYNEKYAVDNANSYNVTCDSLVDEDLMKEFTQYGKKGEIASTCYVSINKAADTYTTHLTIKADGKVRYNK